MRGAGCALCGQVLSLDWKPLARDGIFYALSVLLMLFCIDDGEVNTAEGVVLVRPKFAFETCRNSHSTPVLAQPRPANASSLVSVALTPAGKLQDATPSRWVQNHVI